MAFHNGFRAIRAGLLRSCSQLLALGLIVNGACNNPALTLKKPPAPRPSQEELRQELAQFADYFESSVRGASEELASKGNDRRVMRLCLIWQLQVLPKARSAMDQANPLASLLDLWTLSQRMREFLDTGEGRTLFAGDQEIALSAARDCEHRIIRIADSYLDDAQLNDARKKIEQLCRDMPIRGQFTTPAVHIAEQAGSGDKMLNTILSIPLAPFRALEGVDRTAESIRGFTLVAGRMTGVVQALAADVRLQLQLLLLQTEDLQTIQSVSGSLAQLAQSSRDFAATAEKLPSELRTQLTKAIEDANGNSAELQSTIKEAGLAAQNIDRMAESVAIAGDALADAAVEIEGMVASFRKPSDRTSPVNPTTTSPSFDPDRYRDMAQAIGVSARELQTLSAELRSLTADPELAKRFDRMAEAAKVSGDQVADHMAWRLFQLLLAAFFLALAYRVILRIAHKDVATDRR